MPNKYQSITNFLLKENFKKLKERPKQELISYFQEIETEKLIQLPPHTEDLQNAQTPVSKAVALLEMPTTESNSNPSCFKVMNVTLDLILFIYETIKLILYFDDSLVDAIFYQFSKILSSFYSFSNETIIEGEGVKKGKLKSISQKEISMLSANIVIIRNVLTVLIKNYEDQEMTVQVFTDLYNVYGKLKINCKEKIYELFQHM